MQSFGAENSEIRADDAAYRAGARRMIVHAGFPLDKRHNVRFRMGCRNGEGRRCNRGALTLTLLDALGWERPEVTEVGVDLSYASAVVPIPTNAPPGWKLALTPPDPPVLAHGIDNLRIADGSIIPRVTTGNTMAPCVIIGERAAELIRQSRVIDELFFIIVFSDDDAAIRENDSCGKLIEGCLGSYEAHPEIPSVVARRTDS
jgi:hypothetical protein